MTDESSFEVEAANVEDFLRLLEEREEVEAASQGSRVVTRRAIFVAQMLNQRSSNYAFPLVTRYVVAAFAYGRDAVSYRRTTSNAVELPEIARKTEERQRAAYEEIKGEIKRGLEEIGLDLPIYEGSLHRPAGSRNGE